MNEDKKSISPARSDMVELSEQHANESSEPMKEVKDEIQQPQTKEQEAQNIETSEKSYWLKEKLSIVFGFGALPFSLTFAIMLDYLFYFSILTDFAGMTYTPNERANLHIVFFTAFAGAIAMIGAGIILGRKYEKATKKISVGKMMSIVSGIIIAIVIGCIICNNIYYRLINREPVTGEDYGYPLIAH